MKSRNPSIHNRVFRTATIGSGQRRTVLIVLLLLTARASAQDVVTLEQAASRTGPDFAAAYEGRVVTVRAQVTSPPIWAYGMYYLPLLDSSEHGLILRGDRDRFKGYEPGDWIEARGKIESRAGLPLLVPDSIERVRQTPPPPVKSLPLTEAANFRYLGLLIETQGTVTRVGENVGGTTLLLSDRGATAVAFLARSPSVPNDLLTRIHIGDRVTASGLLTQYAPRPPFKGDFQIMLISPGDLKVSGTAQRLAPLLLLGTIGVGAILLGLWWIRTRRRAQQHSAMRTFHALCEEIIAAPSPSEIAEKLMAVLPSITQATGAWLYIFNRRTKSLERVSTEADPDPMVVPIETPEEDGLANGAAICFETRKQLNIPDVRRSQYLNTRTKQHSPRSAMIVPLTTQGDVLGVLEAGNANRVGYFTIEEQASIQHLANQVAAALKLQEQRAIREQLFRSEKLAATGQLISGVANELRAPLEVILHLSLQMATSLSTPAVRDPESERDLRLLAGESRRASEIVSRLVSFARPEDSDARHFDINALLSGLVQFREPEWKTMELRLQNRLAPEPAFVLGAQGQIEQVFLNLLIHAEQSSADVPLKTVTVATSVIGGRVMVEIGYSAREETPEADPFSESRISDAGALSLGVCRSIVNNHGGAMRFSTRGGLAYFDVELPVVRTETPADSANRKTERSLTILLVDPDPGPLRQLLGLLSLRGHRVVPASEEEAADLAQRLRFDAVLWAMRLSTAGNSKWSEFRERARASITAFVLMSDGYDADLARSIEEAGNFLLGRPIQESELDRVLAQIDARTPSPSRR